MKRRDFSLEISICQIRKIPVWLPEMENLTTLDLSSNALSGEVCIKDMPRLEKLSIMNNPLKAVRVENLPALRICNLSHNRLRKATFRGVNNLEHLRISYNSLRELELKRAPNLRELHISNNQFSTLSLEHLQSLEELDFRKNLIMELPTWLSHLSHLKVLRLQNDFLTDLTKLLSFPHLESVCLQSREFSKKNEKILKELEDKGIEIQFPFH